MFAVRPYLKIPKTATFIEGEKMELECTVYGVPKPDISWKFGKYSLFFNFFFFVI